MEKGFVATNVSMKKMLTNQLENLVEKTTIYKVTDSKYVTIAGGDKSTRYVTDQGTPVTIEQLEPLWQKVYGRFGNKWNKERQLFRLLYDEIRLFVTSFTYLRVHKVDYLEGNHKNQASFRQFSNQLAGMYLFGKKATDLILEIDKLSNANAQKTTFSRHFSNTRNLIFEHNYEPNLLDICIAEPSFFEATSSDSNLRVRIHTSNEAEFNAYVDYYEDYYQLEKVLVDWLEEKV